MKGSDQDFWPLIAKGNDAGNEGYHPARTPPCQATAPMPALQFAADPALTAAGWVRRFMTDPARLTEVFDLYRESGHEVHVEPVRSSELSSACGDCGVLACREYVTVYTRKAA